MQAVPDLADLLAKYVTRSTYKPAQLAKLSGIPKPTIVNWLTGRVKKPRVWQDLLKLAAVLHLSAAEASELLVTTGHPPLDELLTLYDKEPHHTLLAPWLDTIQQNQAKVPFQAIPDLPYFVGREEELQSIKDVLLNGPQNKFCSLQGMAGTGKTTLAAHLAYRLRPFFPDGILWARVDTSTPLTILSTFATAFGHDVNEHTNLDDRSRIVRDLLADKRVLIVLDNVQTSSEVKPLLPPTTGTCAVLMTTRRHDLSVTYGMQRFSLGPFDEEQQEALSLFQKVLGGERVQKEIDTLAEIAELLGHLPLAIVIIANRLAYEPGWQASDILERLRHEKKRMGELVNENQSVQLSFNLSYAALTPDQQQLFAALGTFDAQDFSAEAAAYVNDCAITEAQDQLRKLYGLSMLELGQAQRYRLHPLLRVYARAQINDNGLWLRMVDYFVCYTKQHERDYTLLELEISNILAALQIAFERGMHAALVQGSNALYQFLEVRGLYEVAKLNLDRAEQSAHFTRNPNGLALTRIHQGRLAQQWGDHERARSYLTEGLALAEKSEHLKALGHRFLGWALWQQGQYENACLHLKQALSLARTIPLPQVEADSLNNLGVTHWHLGDYAQAESYYEQAISLYRQINDRWNESGVLLNLGNISLKQGDYDRAYHYLAQGLHISREIGYLQGEGRALNTLGSLRYYQGHHTQAQTYYEQALDIWRKLDYRRGEGMVLRNLGSVLFEQGYYIEAKVYYEQALNLRRESDNQQNEGMELYHLANIHHCLGDYSTSRTLYKKALDIFQTIHYREREGEVLADWGLLMHHLGDDASARTYAKQAVTLAQEIGAHHMQSSALTVLGHALVNLGCPTEAVKVYQQALALRRELGQPHLAAEIVAGLARLSLLQAELPQAMTYVEDILSYLKTGSLDGMKEPFRVYLTCYQVLSAHEDPQAQTVLTTAYHLLQERASKINDKALRQTFLEKVIVHKELVVHAYNSKVVA